MSWTWSRRERSRPRRSARASSRPAPAPASSSTERSCKQQRWPDERLRPATALQSGCTQLRALSRRDVGVPEPILEMRGVNKSFGPVHVLRDIDLAVYPGEVTALVGDNGAGKSTLVKCIAGIHSIDSGTITFEGKPVTLTDPRVASALGIEFVYQDLALADNLDITQNMFLGCEIRRFGFLADGQMERKARETLTGLSVRTVSSVRQSVASLSGGQRQTVAIAKAVLWNSKVLFLDEPTAALGVAQTRQVLDLVRRLADQG